MLLKKPASLSHEQFGQLCEALAYLSDISHEEGSRTISIKFQKFDDLEPQPFLKVEKTTSAGLTELPETETPQFHGGKNAA